MNYLKIQVFVNCSLSAKSWPAVIQKLGGTSPRVERERRIFRSECIVAPSWQLHTITVSRDIYLKSRALFKFFCVCHPTMDMLYEILALQTKLLLSAWVSGPLCEVGGRLFLESKPRPERLESPTKMNRDMS